MTSYQQSASMAGPARTRHQVIRFLSGWSLKVTCCVFSFSLARGCVASMLVVVALKDVKHQRICYTIPSLCRFVCLSGLRRKHSPRRMRGAYGLVDSSSRPFNGLRCELVLVESFLSDANNVSHSIYFAKGYRACFPSSTFVWGVANSERGSRKLRDDILK